MFLIQKRKSWKVTRFHSTVSYVLLWEILTQRRNSRAVTRFLSTGSYALLWGASCPKEEFITLGWSLPKRGIHTKLLGSPLQFRMHYCECSIPKGEIHAQLLGSPPQLCIHYCGVSLIQRRNSREFRFPSTVSYALMWVVSYPKEEFTKSD